MIYIDNFDAPYGRMKMSHMIADTTEELISMCKKIGVNPKWIQYAGTGHEHFDVSLEKKKLAIKEGAVYIQFRELARLRAGRLPNGILPVPLEGMIVK